MSDEYYEYDAEQIVRHFNDALGITPEYWRCNCGECLGGVIFGMGSVDVLGAAQRVLWVASTVVSGPHDPIRPYGIENSSELEALFGRIAARAKKVPPEHLGALFAALRAAAAEFYS